MEELHRAQVKHSAWIISFIFMCIIKHEREGTIHFSDEETQDHC